MSQQTGLLNPMIYQNRKTKQISLITIICAFISVGLNRLLIPQLGAIMAAVTNMVASVCMFGMTLLLARRSYYVKLNFPVLLSSILVVAICYVIDSTVGNIVLALCCKLLLIFAYSVFVLKTRIVKLEDVKYITEKIAEPIIKRFRK